MCFQRIRMFELLAINSQFIFHTQNMLNQGRKAGFTGSMGKGSNAILNHFQNGEWCPDSRINYAHITIFRWWWDSTHSKGIRSGHEKSGLFWARSLFSGHCFVAKANFTKKKHQSSFWRQDPLSQIHTHAQKRKKSWHIHPGKVMNNSRGALSRMALYLIIFATTRTLRARCACFPANRGL